MNEAQISATQVGGLIERLLARKVTPALDSVDALALGDDFSGRRFIAHQDAPHAHAARRLEAAAVRFEVDANVLCGDGSLGERASAQLAFERLPEQLAFAVPQVR